MEFVVPATWKDLKRADNSTFYCPNGHSQHFPEGKTELELEKEKNEKLKRDIEFYKRQNQVEKKSHSATKGQITKLRNRVKNGVCPCCNRHFINLERHMKTKHKDFVK